MNELYLACILIICIIPIYFAKKYKSISTLKYTFITTNILSFLLSFKYVNLGTFNFNSNSIIYITMLTSLYLILELSSKKETKKIVNTTLIINIFSAFTLYLLSLYTQSLNDTVGINITNVFQNNYRILLSFPISIYISSRLLIVVYNKIKKIYDNLFISMTTTYLLIGLVDSIIFTLLAYFNVLNYQILLKILLSTYMVRLIVTVIYSSFLTLISKRKVRK